MEEELGVKMFEMMQTGLPVAAIRWRARAAAWLRVALARDLSYCAVCLSGKLNCPPPLAYAS